MGFPEQKLTQTLNYEAPPRFNQPSEEVLLHGDSFRQQDDTAIHTLSVESSTFQQLLDETADSPFLNHEYQNLQHQKKTANKRASAKVESFGFNSQHLQSRDAFVQDRHEKESKDDIMISDQRIDSERDVYYLNTSNIVSDYLIRGNASKKSQSTDNPYAYNQSDSVKSLATPCFIQSPPSLFLKGKPSSKPSNH